jgi:hypothetical protein
MNINTEQTMKGVLNLMGMAGIARTVQSLTRVGPELVALNRNLAIKFASEVVENSKSGTVLIHFKKPHGTAIAGTNPKPVSLYTECSTCLTLIICAGYYDRNSKNSQKAAFSSTRSFHHTSISQYLPAHAVVQSHLVSTHCLDGKFIGGESRNYAMNGV